MLPFTPYSLVAFRLALPLLAAAMLCAVFGVVASPFGMINTLPCCCLRIACERTDVSSARHLFLLCAGLSLRWHSLHPEAKRTHRWIH